MLMEQCLLWALLVLQTCTAAPRGSTSEEGNTECDFDNIVKCLERQVRWIPKRFTDKQQNKTASYSDDNAFFREICRRNASQCWKDNKSEACSQHEQESLDRFRNANNAALKALCETDMSLIKDLFATFQLWDLEKFTNCTAVVSATRVGLLFSGGRPQDCRFYRVRMRECLVESYKKGTQVESRIRDEFNATKAAWSLLEAFLSHMSCNETDYFSGQGDFSNAASPSPSMTSPIQQVSSGGPFRPPNTDAPCSAENPSERNIGTGTKADPFFITSTLYSMHIATTTRKPASTITNPFTSTNTRAMSTMKRKSVHFDSSSVTTAFSTVDDVNERAKESGHTAESTTEDEDENFKRIGHGINEGFHLIKAVSSATLVTYPPASSGTTGTDKYVAMSDHFRSPAKTSLTDDAVLIGSTARTTAKLITILTNKINKRRDVFDYVERNRETQRESSNIPKLTSVPRLHPVTSEARMTHCEPCHAQSTVDDQRGTKLFTTALTEQELTTERPVRKAETPHISSGLNVSLDSTTPNTWNRTDESLLLASDSSKVHARQETEDENVTVHSSLATSADGVTVTRLYTVAIAQTLLTESGNNNLPAVSEQSEERRAIIQQRDLESKGVANVATHTYLFFATLLLFVTMCLFT